MDNLIKCLWVEDDKEVMDTYPLEAEEYGLDLRSFSCWEDAYAELQRNYNAYDAIILDAKCKESKNAQDNANRFLSESLSTLSRLSVGKTKFLPWYILSGGAEEEINDLIINDRLRWDRDWTEKTNKKYYSKLTDRESLFKRIKSHCGPLSEKIQIKKEYSVVFDAIERLGLGENFSELLLNDLLKPMLHPASIFADFQSHNETLISKIRLLFDDLHAHMIEKGIIPSQCKLGMMPQILGRIGNNLYKFSDDSKPLLPSPITMILKQLVIIANTTHHSGNSKENKNGNGQQEAKIYLETVPSPFLANGCVLFICDFILWYDDYIIQHPYIEENKKYCQWNSTK